MNTTHDQQLTVFQLDQEAQRLAALIWIKHTIGQPCDNLKARLMNKILLWQQVTGLHWVNVTNPHFEPWRLSVHYQTPVNYNHLGKPSYDLRKYLVDHRKGKTIDEYLQAQRKQQTRWARQAMAGVQS